jgi:hypothetical protein
MMQGKTSMTLGEGMKGMGADIFISLFNTSYTITADLEVPASGNGVIVCQGGRFGGFSFYMRGGKPIFTYNYLGLEQFQVTSSEPLKPGKYSIKYDFTYDGGGAGKGGTGMLSVNGEKVAESRIAKTEPTIFSGDDMADVGVDEGTPVADYGLSPKFNGKIHKVTIDVRK